MVSKKTKFYYGLGDLSSNILFGAISFYLLYFMINVGGLTPYLAGIVFMVARIWDAVTDYLMGRISDRTKSKYGKRRIYMLFGAIPFGFTFILLWLTPDTADQTLRFLYYTLVYMLYNTAWTIVYIPYNALTANITNDYDERTSLNTVRIIMANVGLLLGAALFALFSDGVESLFYQYFGSLKLAYAMSGIVFGLIAGFTMLLCAYKTKEKYDNSEENRFGFFQTLKQFFKLKEFRNTTLYYLFSMIGFDVVMAVFIFLVNDSLGFSGGDESMLFVALPLVVAISSAIIWDKLSAKYSKYKVYAAAAVYISVCLSLCIFIPAQSYFALGLVCVLVGFGMSAIQILPYASIPDVVEVDEYYHHVRREGSYYGIMSLMYKLASGLSIALVSWILELADYVEDAPVGYVQSAEALFAIRLIIGVIPGIIFLTSIIFAFRTNITRERFNKIKAELTFRKSNKGE